MSKYLDATPKPPAAQVGALLAQAQEATGEKIEVAFVDQGHTGEEPAEQAAREGVRLVVVKLPEAKKVFCPDAGSWSAPSLGRRASVGWHETMEKLPSSLAGLHWLAFLTLMLNSIFH